jgi:diguanylate cyclase (GGDEF)-like protein/PAS domain S-box-containing protein
MSTLPSTPNERNPSHLQRARRALLRLLVRARRPVSRQSLKTTIAVLKAQQDAMLDGILVIDREGRVMSYNRRFLEIWRIPESAATSGDDNELLGYAAELVEDWDEFINLVSYLYSNPEEVRVNDAVPLKDGRILARNSVPVRVGHNVMGRAWYFRDVTEEKAAARLQSAMFRIAALTESTERLEDLYRAVHGVIGELMFAKNFFIAEYDKDGKTLVFPYFVDQFDTAPEGLSPGHGITAYVLRTGEPILATPEVFDQLVARGEVELVGQPSVDWLGAPLKSGDRTWGVIGLQIYDDSQRYTERHKEILLFVAQHVATAIEQKRNDANLRASERRYRQMFENNRAVQLLLDPTTGVIVDANTAACDFYGYTREELRALRVWDINVLGEAGVREEMAKAQEQQRSYFIFRHILANGDLRDVEVHSGPVNVGDRLLLYSIIHDITERKRAERALVESEERYRNIFDYASVGIYQTTPEGDFIAVNDTMAHMLGYDSVDDLLVRNMRRDVYYDPEFRDDLIRRFGFGSIEKPISHEVLWKRKDGSLLWVTLNAHTVRSSHGVTYFEGFVYDITERRIAEERLASANAQRKAVLDAATQVSIIATDPDGTITVFNSGAERMLGYAADEMIGKRSLLDLHVAWQLEQQALSLTSEFRHDIGGFDALSLRAAIHGHEEREWTYIAKGGHEVSVLVSVTSIRSEGTITGFLHVGTDITERKSSEETLRTQSAAITASMDGIGILNDRLDFTYSNDALAKLFGHNDPGSIVGTNICDLYEPPEQVRFVTTILPIVQQRGRWRGEATGLRSDGTTFPQEISLSSIDGGGLVAVVRDITERTYAEEQIKHLAYHDALTGLPNRLLFKDRVTVALSHAQRNNSRLAVLFLDLDRFKVINDSLGHNIGDRLLQEVASRVEACLRDSDTVARLGGDEFTILLPNLIHSDDAAPVAQKILDSIRAPFHIEERELFTSTSIGISLYPEDAADAETLIKNADTAMYQAKEQGRDNYQLFNAHVNARALQRIALEHGLRRALVNEEFDVFFQPIVDLRTGVVTGMEALLRWNHPELGSIPPSTFIPLAESTGIMMPIGAWALRQACLRATEWQAAGFRNLSLAVNLSVTQLQSVDLVQRVRDALEETGLPPEQLELEITESSAMQSPEISLRVLRELKKLGIRISLDDFGTGHSSLAYLKRLPIDTLKIDQSFVRDIDADPNSAAIVTAIIAMAHSLRLKVIAEGVEHEEQAMFLRRYGCDLMQGFLFTKPVPAHEFGSLLASLFAK